MDPVDSILTFAQKQIELGFAVFRLRPNTKAPATPHGFKDATRDPAEIARQLSAAHGANYGIVWPVEAANPVLAIDIDNGGNGAARPWEDRLRELMQRFRPLPSTKATTTPSGGRHGFYAWPPEIPIPTGDEALGFTARWPGRGYLVGPGSSIDGHFDTANGIDSIADLPQKWVDAVRDGIPAAGRREQTPPSLVIGVTAGFELPDTIPAGRRYPTMRDYVASRYNNGLSRDEIWHLVQIFVAPRFEVLKDLSELRADFDRAIKDLPRRFGPPKRATAQDDLRAEASPIAVVRLADIPVDEVEWVWHRYLPAGCVTIFDGNPGEGKSTIVADVVARITRGSTWPDGTEVGAPGTVVYATKEDDAATQVRPRLEAAGGDAKRVVFVGDDLIFPRDLERFHELLIKVRPRLAVLDPLMSYLDDKVRTVSDNGVRSALMTPLGALAREIGCAILIVRHFNKNMGSQALLRGAGSLGGLAGAARCVVAVVGDPEAENDGARVFGVVKSNYEAIPHALKATIESAPVLGHVMTVSKAVWHGESETQVAALMERTPDEQQNVVDARDRLWGILNAAGGRVPAQDAMTQLQKAGFSRNAIYRAAKDLAISFSRDAFHGRGFWSLPACLFTHWA
jgi:hypothetical protein